MFHITGAERKIFSTIKMDQNVINMVLVAELELCHQLSLDCNSCFSIFDLQWMQAHTRRRQLYVFICGCKFMFILLSAHNLYIMFILGPKYWMSRLVAVKVLIFSVSQSAYSIIYSEKYAICYSCSYYSSMNTWNYNTNRNNMQEYSFIKVYCFAWLWSRAWLNINKKQNISCYYATNLLKTWFFFLVCKKGKKRGQKQISR